MINIANTIKDIAIIVGIPMFRSVAGWAVKALEDKKVTKFEWKLLASTVIRVGLIGLAGYFGLNGLGIDVSALGAAFSAVIVDKAFGLVKGKKQ